MKIISQARLEKAVYSCKGQMEKVASHVLPEKREAFLQAVSTYNAQKINAIINESFQLYFGDSNLLRAFEKYCAKFGMEKDFSTMADANIILYIAEKYSDVNNMLDQAGFPTRGV